VEHDHASPSLHQRIAGALSRAERAQEDSRALIAECRRASVALRETVETLHHGRDTRAAARPER
jgi:hypothetical protein